MVWSPTDNGLSVSGLNLWLQDRFAFNVYYLEGLEAVQTWRKEMAYGSLVQAGIEGWIKTQQTKGMLRFIQQEFDRQVEEYGLSEEIEWWAKLACHQCSIFVDLYAHDLPQLTTSERHAEALITLPSGREIKLHGYLDGEGPAILFENKVRGKWDVDVLTDNLPMDLQYNYYLLLLQSEGTLPDLVWYQHCRRPGSWGFKGPRRKKSESKDEHRLRTEQHMTDNKDYYFYRYFGKPTLQDLEKFCYACMYPMLEAFLDWYEFKMSSDSPPNRFDWMTPYGLYNPFTEGTPEKFREYRLTGSSAGLRRRK